MQKWRQEMLLTMSIILVIFQIKVKISVSSWRSLLFSRITYTNVRAWQYMSNLEWDLLA